MTTKGKLKLLPVIVTVVPPVEAPEVVLRLETSGGATNVSSVDPEVEEVPFGP